MRGITTSHPAMGVLLFAWLAVLSGCAAVNTFPTIARSGDTVSVMVGGSENARKETIGVMLTDAAGGQWDLQALGLVRSVFNLRPDGRAHGMHYSPYGDLYVSWLFGHEPVQTVLVVDLPLDAQPGQATLTVSLNVNDNSSGISDPFAVRFEIIPGVGVASDFRRKTGSTPEPANFADLEPAPNLKISFGSGVTVGAASLVVDVDQGAVNLDDLNVYVPEATLRGNFSTVGAFGDKQRMVYWRHDGDRLYIDVVAPQGVDSRFLQLFVVHPRGLATSPNFTIQSVAAYDVNGNTLSLQPRLVYAAE